MNDAEFLDYFEHRCINGAVFSPEEANRLWALCGFKSIPTKQPVFFRNAGSRNVQIARTRLTKLVLDRLTEK